MLPLPLPLQLNQLYLYHIHLRHVERLHTCHGLFFSWYAEFYKKENVDQTLSTHLLQYINKSEDKNLVAKWNKNVMQDYASFQEIGILSMAFG